MEINSILNDVILSVFFYVAALGHHSKPNYKIISQTLIVNVWLLYSYFVFKFGLMFLIQCVSKAMKWYTDLSDVSRILTLSIHYPSYKCQSDCPLVFQYVCAPFRGLVKDDCLADIGRCTSWTRHFIHYTTSHDFIHWGLQRW